MFSRFLASALKSCALVLATLAFSATAHASALKADKGEQPFNNADMVSDQELSTMRGGFMDINGVLIDMSFLSRVQVGLDVQTNVNVNTNNLANAAQSATQIQQLLQPNIITNVDPNTLISIQQALNINVLNPNQLAAIQSLHQLGFQQMLGH
jgi:hypothetical protein